MIHRWLGYPFKVYLYDSHLLPVAPGVYVFAAMDLKSLYAPSQRPLYVGSTDHSKDRFSTHEKFSEAEELGLSHIHFLVEESKEAREEIEKALIQEYKPPLNDPLK